MSCELESEDWIDKVCHMAQEPHLV